MLARSSWEMHWTIKWRGAEGEGGSDEDFRGMSGWKAAWVRLRCSGV